MSFPVTQSLLALGLVLGCALGQAAAQTQDAAKPQASLWSVLNLPTLDRLTRPAKPKPKLPTTAEKKSPPAELSIELPVIKPPTEPPPESAVASPFSPTNSSRRGVIQKRELAQGKSAPAQLNLPPNQPPVTPHWTPKFVEQAAYLQLADDELARPVAVNMAGDLISQRVTVARAVARLDPTLSVAPSVARATARLDASEPTPAAQLATASPAAAH